MYLTLSNEKAKNFKNCTLACITANLWSNRKNSVVVVDGYTGEIMLEKKNNKTVWKSKRLWG